MDVPDQHIMAGVSATANAIAGVNLPNGGASVMFYDREQEKQIIDAIIAYFNENKIKQNKKLSNGLWFRFLPAHAFVGCWNTQIKILNTYEYKTNARFSKNDVRLAV